MKAAAPALALMVASCATATQPAPMPPAPSLAGEWRVIAVNGRPTSGSVRIGPHVALFNFGCNDGRAGYRLEPTRLSPIMPFGTTEKACFTPGGEPALAMQKEVEGFRIAIRPMRIDWYGPNRARLSNDWGTIDLVR